MSPPGKPQGNDRLSHWLGKLVDYIESTRVTSVYGGRVSQGPSGTQIIIGADAQGNQISIGSIERFTIATAFDNYLLCQPLDNTGAAIPGAPAVTIAKHVAVRGNPVHETRSEGVVTYRETVYPSFSGVIYAGKVANKTDVVAADGLPCEWIDLTPRAWKPGLVTLDLCRVVDGVERTFHVTVAGGPIYGPDAL